MMKSQEFKNRFKDQLHLIENKNNDLQNKLETLKQQIRDDQKEIYKHKQLTQSQQLVIETLTNN